MFGPQVDTNNAIQVLKYRLEVPENLNPSSVVWHYNTQSGGNVEFFTVTVSDQGYTSSTNKERVVQASVGSQTEMRNATRAASALLVPNPPKYISTSFLSCLNPGLIPLRPKIQTQNGFKPDAQRCNLQTAQLIF
jgi:hypothetical protein